MLFLFVCLISRNTLKGFLEQNLGCLNLEGLCCPLLLACEGHMVLL